MAQASGQVAAWDQRDDGHAKKERVPASERVLHVIDAVFLRIPRKALLLLAKKKVGRSVEAGWGHKVSPDHMVRTWARTYLLWFFWVPAALAIFAAAISLCNDAISIAAFFIVAGVFVAGGIWVHALARTIAEGADLAGAIAREKAARDGAPLPALAGDGERRWDAWASWADAQSDMAYGLRCLLVEGAFAENLVSNVCTGAGTLGAPVISFLSLGHIGARGEHLSAVQQRIDKAQSHGDHKRADEILDGAESDWEHNASVACDLAAIWSSALCGVHVGVMDLASGIESAKESGYDAESRKGSPDPLTRLVLDRGIEGMLEAYISGVPVEDIVA